MSTNIRGMSRSVRTCMLFQDGLVIVADEQFVATIVQSTLRMGGQVIGYGIPNKNHFEKSIIHSRLGSATLSQLAFPGESNPNFIWEKSHWDNSVAKNKN